MSGSSRPGSVAARALLAVAALAVVAAPLPDGAAGPFGPGWGMWLDDAIGLAFVLAGLAAWSRRPENRIGLVMVVAGFAWWAHLLILTRTPVTFTLGVLLEIAFVPVLAYAVLGFPDGRLRQRWEKVTVGLLTLTVALDSLFIAFFDPADFGCRDCDGLNLLLISPSKEVMDAKGPVLRWALTAGLVILVVATARRWRRGSAVARRVAGPMYVPATVWAIAYALYLHVPRLENTLFQPGSGIDQVLLNTFGFAVLAVPAAFLWGIRQARGRHANVSSLVREMGELPSLERLESALAKTLGDPSLRLIRGGGHVPDDVGGRTVTPLGRQGALLHDPALLLDDRELLEAVASAARLALENQQLQEQVRRHLDEVHASRARIVAATDDARRGIERDLHDGAQARLVSLLVSLRLAEIQIGPEADPRLRESLVTMADQLNEAIDELREIARGVHPSVLTDEGLAAALYSLAERASIAVEIDAVPERRLPDPVEAAAYFLVAEALTNATRHSGAAAVYVRATAVGEALEVEVRDAGTGGASPARGTGLRGLGDRIEAMGGSFSVTSPAGEGTLLRAAIPLAGSASFEQRSQVPR